MDTSGLHKIPRHVAIIMDGNGRWAQRHGLTRLEGHRSGSESVRAVLRGCRDAGVEYLTLFAFSSENWHRAEQEISGLMTLLEQFINRYKHELHRYGICLRISGHPGSLPSQVQQQLDELVNETQGYPNGTIVLAVNYGGRTEVVDAARALARKVQAGDLEPEDIDEGVFADHLYNPDIPDPDLLIRTSGEMRLSNFLLWQLSYSEIYVTDVLWPDFREEEFRAALESYGRRERRFGKVSSGI